jgi:hypothetical protein
LCFEILYFEQMGHTAKIRQLNRTYQTNRTYSPRLNDTVETTFAATPPS